MSDKHKNTSKFLSLILRHTPEVIGLELDANGWASVAELITKATAYGFTFSMEELEQTVATNDKQRFIFNEDKTHIRANQGHSVQIDLNLTSQEPPSQLYHGTVDRFIEMIKGEGLKKMSRQHVHLSRDIETAQKVGNRRGDAIILTINSEQMHQDGFDFYVSENGVWLTDHVPAKYISTFEQ